MGGEVEDENQLEVRLGIVNNKVREVQNVQTINNQKVDKEEFVTIMMMSLNYILNSKRGLLMQRE